MSEKGALFVTVAPTLPVSDLEDALYYYINFLGFRIIVNNPTVFAVVGRDNVRIGLQTDPTGEKAGTANCYIWTSNIQEIFEEYKTKGALFLQELKPVGNNPVHDFLIEDPDGNTIGIGEA
jgi:catechol 2,3-dioxygenase-like lactoylglutathione lyase family enzyme